MFVVISLYDFPPFHILYEFQLNSFTPKDELSGKFDFSVWHILQLSGGLNKKVTEAPLPFFISRPVQHNI